MKLTGKAQEDFDLWFFERSTPIEEYKNYPNLSDTCKNALIVEWFDSVDIYVNALKYSGFFKSIAKYERGEKFNTRNGAINAAIEKANELYNNDK